MLQVRHFFVRLLVVLMEKSREDPADRISQFRRMFWLLFFNLILLKYDYSALQRAISNSETGESVSDALIRTLLTLPTMNSNDFHRHPCQYFALFYHYASLGPVEVSCSFC